MTVLVLDHPELIARAAAMEADRTAIIRATENNAPMAVQTTGATGDCRARRPETETRVWAPPVLALAD